MRRTALVVLVFSVAVAACGGGSTPSGVASLDQPGAPVGTDDGVVDDEALLLEFASCMRGNGVDNFRDPYVDADGKVVFPDKAPGSGEPSTDNDATAASKDATVFDEAFDTCRSLLDSTAFAVDKKGEAESKKADQLYDFAVCMREEGFDMPDPDPATGDLGDIDKQSPGFMAAYTECASVFTGDNTK